jgi:hypothetical protein
LAGNKPFWKTWNFIAGVVILVAALTFIAIRLPGQKTDEEKDQAFFTQAVAKLEKARTATVTLSGTFHPEVGAEKVHWTGTTLAAFAGGSSNWQTTFSPMEVWGLSTTGLGDHPIQLKAVHTGSQTVYSSPSFVLKDKKPWVDPKTTAIVLPSRLADLGLGLTDLNTWLPILGRVSPLDAEDAANPARTKAMAAVSGAPHKFMVRCSETGGECPPPWHTDIDQLFPDDPQPPIIYAWFDDDGMLRQLRVTGPLYYDPAQHPADTDGAHDAASASGEFTYYLTFTFSGFGSPATITAPAADQITSEQYVAVAR